jgi:hypothetical protein
MQAPFFCALDALTVNDGNRRACLVALLVAAPQIEWRWMRLSAL